jgi:uncharacterized protein YcaQ
MSANGAVPSERSRTQRVEPDPSSRSPRYDAGDGEPISPDPAPGAGVSQTTRRAMIHLSREAARRFILGGSGLWPGRRWQGMRGTERAMRTLEHLQLDPLQIMARAQDLMLHSRVDGYAIDDWAILTYERRRFFDWGGWLAVRPMEELPHWRVRMRRERESPHFREVHDTHAAAIEEMREVLRRRRTVANRDFAMGDRTRVDSYRGRKDSALALHYLWRVGEVMVSRRERFERAYALSERVAPKRLLRESPDAEADDFLLRKMVAAAGISALTGANGALDRTVPRAELHAWRDARVDDGTLVEVDIEGWPGRRWAHGSDASALRLLARGRIPAAWRPLGRTTTDEAVFLAPLDPVMERARARALWDFDYTWEVYVPAAKRRFGYYTLPVLWGDALVARFDGRLDRASRTLHILSLWLEDESLADDPSFADALGRGMTRFAGFLGAQRVEAAGVRAPLLRRAAEGAARTPVSEASPTRP